MCPPKITQTCIACILLVALQACRPNPNTTILFENRSTKQLDSVEISIQQYRLVFYQVAPNTSVNRLLPKDSVHNSTHTLALQATIHAPHNSSMTGDYRNDSSKDMAVMYTITYTDTYQLQIRPGYRNAFLR